MKQINILKSILCIFLSIHIVIYRISLSISSNYFLAPPGDNELVESEIEKSLQMNIEELEKLENILQQPVVNVSKSAGIHIVEMRITLDKLLKYFNYEIDTIIYKKFISVLKKVLTNPKTDSFVHGSIFSMLTDHYSYLYEKDISILSILQEVIKKKDLDKNCYRQCMLALIRISKRQPWYHESDGSPQLIHLLETILSTPGLHPIVYQGAVHVMMNEYERNPALIEKNTLMLASYFVFFDNFAREKVVDIIDMNEEYYGLYDISILDRYKTNHKFLWLRWLLLNNRFHQIKRSEYTTEAILNAFLQNNLNLIISQTSDLLLYYEGNKGITIGMITLKDKFKYQTVTLRDIKDVLKKSRIEVDEAGVEKMLNKLGVKLFKKHNIINSIRKNPIIIPEIFDCLLSGYRGSSEHDHTEASYLTHAITTSIIKYAMKSGERAKSGREDKRAYGPNAFHEFDLSVLALEKRNNKRVDENVSLAFSYPPNEAMPEYSRKRTVLLRGKTLKEHLETLMQNQGRERRAKHNILMILESVSKGRYNNKQLEVSLYMMKNQINILQRNCGLRKEYFEYLFGCLDESFYSQLKAAYKTGADNGLILTNLLNERLYSFDVVERLRIKINGDSDLSKTGHPWEAHNINLLRYLRYESRTRKNTFDESLMYVSQLRKDKMTKHRTNFPGKIILRIKNIGHLPAKILESL